MKLQSKKHLHDIAQACRLITDIIQMNVPVLLRETEALLAEPEEP